ncbi:ComEA family DNA-binding protein [Photobacterium aphoticum]|nr:helix-hairpin-helix domain-containing protein [Photobacterium aphoticum]GHA38560.1 hypothetical protein GCM10007086_10110 [Photobacterium aphoticum]
MKNVFAAMGLALLMGMATPGMAAEKAAEPVTAAVEKAVKESTKVDSHEGIVITVNINTANAEELDKLLLGVGPDKAAKIIEYRQANGFFDTPEALSNVKGIGAATVEKNRERIQL